MKTVAIVQARLGSTRLPGKVLLDLAGEPMLARVVHRLRRAQRLDELVIATTTEPRDDALADLCAARGWPCSRGSESDVLDRYYRAALEAKADVVVRVTSDCPLIEPAIVDLVLAEFAKSDVDYASNVGEPRTYPRGLDVEVFPFTVLDRLWHEDQNPTWREHVTEMIHQRPELFRTINVCHSRDWSHLRWTVDTPEDFELVRRIYAHFGNDDFSWEEVLGQIETHPDWIQINSSILQKVV